MGITRAGFGRVARRHAYTPANRAATPNAKTPRVEARAWKHALTTVKRIPRTILKTVRIRGLANHKIRSRASNSEFRRRAYLIRKPD